jgi:hypothetical protein
VKKILQNEQNAYLCTPNEKDGDRERREDVKRRESPGIALRKEEKRKRKSEKDLVNLKKLLPLQPQRKWGAEEREKRGRKSKNNKADSK